MTEATDQIKTDVQDLQAATQAAVDYIDQLESTTVSDEQITNLHNAIVSCTEQLRQAVPT